MAALLFLYYKVGHAGKLKGLVVTMQLSEKHNFTPRCGRKKDNGVIFNKCFDFRLSYTIYNILDIYLLQPYQIKTVETVYLSWWEGSGNTVSRAFRSEGFLAYPIKLVSNQYDMIAKQN